MEGLSDGSALTRAAQQYLRDIARTRESRDVSPAGRGEAMVCVTGSDGNYPHTAQAVYVLIPQSLDADDVEGAGANASNDGETDLVSFYGINVGSAIPKQGVDQFLVSSCGGRWVFRWDG